MYKVKRSSLSKHTSISRIYILFSISIVKEISSITNFCYKANKTVKISFFHVYCFLVLTILYVFKMATNWRTVTEYSKV